VGNLIWNLLEIYWPLQ